jgi:hypothetical protein
MPNDSADRGVGEAARDSEQSNTVRYTVNLEAALSATGGELQHGETTLRAFVLELIALRFRSSVDKRCITAQREHGTRGLARVNYGPNGATSLTQKCTLGQCAAKRLSMYLFSVPGRGSSCKDEQFQRDWLLSLQLRSGWDILRKRTLQLERY